MTTNIEKLRHQQWRRDLVWRAVELAVALGAWALLTWALVTAIGHGS
ncbi:MAG: hypothetical protein ACE5HL_09900 [Terriglobia bacterium]